MSLHAAQLALSPLVLYWCNETSGSTANDTSGNVNGPYNLTIGSSVTKNSTKLVPTDPTNGSFFMSNATVGANQTVRATGALPSYLKPTTAATVEAVIQVFSTSLGSGCFSLTSSGTAGQEQMLLGTGNPASGTGNQTSGTLTYSTDGTTPVQSTLNPGYTVTANAQHIVMTFGGGGGATPTQILYINGLQRGSAITLPSGALLFYPAADNNGPSMYNDSQLAIVNPNMRISNAAIYGFAMTPAQVSANYSAFSGGGLTQNSAFSGFNRFEGMNRF